MASLGFSQPLATGLPVFADVPFVAFDTETTGLHATDRLVELAAVRFRGDVVEGEWSALVDPGLAIPAAATAVHGITDGHVSGRPFAAEVLPGFLGFIEGAALVAHNAPFDIRVLALELLHAGMPLPDNPVLDTCALSRRLELLVPDHRLATLARAFGVPHGRGHRALADARVAGSLLRAYLRDQRGAAEPLVRQALTRDLLSFRLHANAPVPASPLVSLVRRARAEQRAVILAPFGPGSTVRVVPRDLYAIGGSVYLEGDCAQPPWVRTFPAERIAAARLE
jgi:DNA polymerase III epsilon subunit family exonuclease